MFIAGSFGRRAKAGLDMLIGCMPLNFSSIDSSGQLGDDEAEEEFP